MRSATELLTQYAAYHRDRRNILTHFVGIPLIVFAIGALLSRPAFTVGEWTLTPAMVFAGGATIWYLSRSVVLGGITAVLSIGLFALGHLAAASSTAAWLGWGLGTFFVGWVLQFIGHYYEGRKPAFVDDLIGLLVGPMFIVAEGLFAAGWNGRLHDEIESRVGPTHLRNLAHA